MILALLLLLQIPSPPAQLRATEEPCCWLEDSGLTLVVVGQHVVNRFHVLIPQTSLAIQVRRRGQSVTTNIEVPLGVIDEKPPYRGGWGMGLNGQCPALTHGAQLPKPDAVVLIEGVRFIILEINLMGRCDE